MNKAKKWVSLLLTGLVALGSAPNVTAETNMPIDVNTTKVVAVQPVSTEIKAFALTKDTAKKEVLQVLTVVQAVRSANEAYEDWNNSIARAKDLDTEKFSFKNPFTGETITKTFDDKTQMQLRIQKYLQPDQMKYAYEMAKRTADMTMLRMEITVDGILLGLYSAQNDILLKESDRKIASQDLTRKKAQKAAGMITQLDVDLSTLALEKAEKALLSARRSFENTSRSYNQLVGAPLDRELSVTLSGTGLLPLLPPDDYVVQALQNRMELYSLRTNIQLQEKMLELYTFKNLHETDEDTISSYRSTTLSIAKMKVELDVQIRSITWEIRAAYLELQMSDLDIQSTRKSLEEQKINLKNMKKQIDAGRLPAWSADQLESAVNNLSNAVDLSKISLDQSIKRFRFATGNGPAY